MARLARFVVPGLPHLVTQRGNRREPVFFSAEDYALYRDLLAEACDKAEVAVWAHSLMPNHVHLVLTPTTPDGLARALGKAHRRYSAFVNARLRVMGHLFQSRFGSVVMDEDHLLVAARHVALNPVRARLVERAEDWPWSSVREHSQGRGDGLVDVKPLLDRLDGRFVDLLDAGRKPESFVTLRAAEGIGRPLGSPAFLERVAALSGRDPRPGKPGRRPKSAAGNSKGK